MKVADATTSKRESDNMNCKLQIINYKLISDYGKHFFKDCSRRDS